ncbi:hypothetical protein HYY75_05340 [bacterium]|nr:hypothetical protein [bacterium]
MARIQINDIPEARKILREELKSISGGALNAFLVLTGETQGEIKGLTQARFGFISNMLIATSHEVVSPRDTHSGLPTG